VKTNELEEPVFLAAAGETLFGIHAHATLPSRRIGVILVHGGDKVNAAMSRNRVGVQLARQLAGDGYDVFRFAYHGVGESSGTVEAVDIHRPFTDDVVGAAPYLRSVGIEGFVLIGVCFGSRTALSSAELIDGTKGVVMAAPPSSGYNRTEASAAWIARNRSLRGYVASAIKREKVAGLLDRQKRREYLKMARIKARHMIARFSRHGRRNNGNDEFGWVSPVLTGPLEHAAQAGINVLFLFGTDDPWLAEFNEAGRGPLGQILTDGRDTIEIVDDVPGIMNGLVEIEAQRAFSAHTTAWLHRRVPGRQSASKD